MGRPHRPVRAEGAARWPHDRRLLVHVVAEADGRPREAQAEHAGVYSLVCFYVDARAKRQGVQTALLDAAVAHAKRNGARAVEAYPHASDPRDYMGTVELFKRAGFKPVRESGKRAIMRFEP